MSDTSVSSTTSGPCLQLTRIHPYNANQGLDEDNETLSIFRLER
ncbi:hypothetical protein ACF8EA_13510 [Pseudomonas sp. YQ_5]